jgi:transcriptional regulator with XRE-family HTH domain
MTHTELEQAKDGIGARLREARISRGLTQVELAKLAGTNQAVVQHIENGVTRHTRMVGGLAIALDVNPAWLQWGERFASMQVE